MHAQGTALLSELMLSWMNEQLRAEARRREDAQRLRNVEIRRGRPQWRVVLSLAVSGLTWLACSGIA